MKNCRFLLPACVLALALTACGPSSGDDLHPDDAALLSTPATTDAEPGPSAGSPAPALATQIPADAPQPVTLADNALAIGSALGADGAVTGAQATYAAASSIHASVPTGGYAPGTAVTIYWFAPNGTSIKTESKPIPTGAKFVNFTLDSDTRLAAGTYTAQVDVGEMPAGMVDFSIK